MKSLGKANKNMGFLTHENGMLLSMFRPDEVSYPDTFYVGFIQASAAKVDDINTRRKANGYDVPEPPARLMDVLLYGSGGFAVEVLS